jgi:hypothetical protein
MVLDLQWFLIYWWCRSHLHSVETILLQILNLDPYMGQHYGCCMTSLNAGQWQWATAPTCPHLPLQQTLYGAAWLSWDVWGLGILGYCQPLINPIVSRGASTPKFVTGIWLRYGSWKVLRSAVGRLKTQSSWQTQKELMFPFQSKGKIGSTDRKEDSTSTWEGGLSTGNQEGGLPFLF